MNECHHCGSTTHDSGGRCRLCPNTPDAVSCDRDAAIAQAYEDGAKAQREADVKAAQDAIALVTSRKRCKREWVVMAVASAVAAAPLVTDAEGTHR